MLRRRLLPLALVVVACQCDGGLSSAGQTLTVAPAELDFGAVDVGATAERSALVRMVGRGTLLLQSLRLDSSDASLSFADVTGPLEESGSRALLVRWTPARDGALENGLSVFSDNAPPVRVRLVGRATRCSDGDGDGAGSGSACLLADCDDADGAVHPGAPERCNGRDDDCDGLVDEQEVCPPDPTEEVCNGADDDRDGLVDEGEVCPPTSVERCNGLDDDRNGVTDDVPGAGGACLLADGSGPLGLQCSRAGLLACNAGSGTLECRPVDGEIECTAPCPSGDVAVRVTPYFPGEMPGMVFQNPAGNSYSQPIDVTFSPPVMEVAVTCVDPDFDGNTVESYDAAGLPIELRPFVHDNQPGSQPPNTDTQTLQGGSGRPIARLRLTPSPIDYVGYSTIGVVCP